MSHRAVRQQNCSKILYLYFFFFFKVYSASMH